MQSNTAKRALAALCLLAVLFGAGIALVGLQTLIATAEYAGWRWRPGGESMTSGLVDVGDVSLYYERSGHGPTIVLLHGGGASIEVFFAQIPHLARHFDVIALDTRGHGRSSRGKQPLDYRQMADDVDCALRRFGVERASFIGWSDGGITSIFLALAHPSRVQRLVLVSVNFDPSGLREPDDTDAMRPGLLAQMAYRWLSPAPERWSEHAQELVQLWHSRPRLTRAQLSQIAVPTLLLVGENDLIDLDHARLMRTAIADAQLHIVAGATHGLLWERPVEINQQIDKFLRSALLEPHAQIAESLRGADHECASSEQSQP